MNKKLVDIPKRVKRASGVTICECWRILTGLYMNLKRVCGIQLFVFPIEGKE
jgi:hypothetical protein